MNILTCNTKSDMTIRVKRGIISSANVVIMTFFRRPRLSQLKQTSNTHAMNSGRFLSDFGSEKS